MSNFEKNLDQHLMVIDNQIGDLNRERSNLDWGHDCDCEFCDVNEPIPEETEERSDQIKLEIKKLVRFKEVITSHVERYGGKK